MYIWPIPNVFRNRAISLYSCKIVDTEILGIVSSIGIYCSSEKVSTGYLVQHIFENSTTNINALFNSCEDMSCFWTFPYAGDNIHYEIGQFVSCVHFCSIHFTLQPTP